MNRFVTNKYDPTSFHTIGVEFLNKEIQVHGQLYTIQIWDTAGQERFKSLRTPFYRGSDICLLTFALDDKRSLQDLSTWRDEFLYYADVHDVANFPFIVLGNKVDVEPDKRVVSKEAALEWCGANGNMPFIETSAKDSTNVVLAFQTAVEKWVKADSMHRVHRPYAGQTISLTGAGRSSGAGERLESRSASGGITSTCCFQ